MYLLLYLITVIHQQRVQIYPTQRLLGRSTEHDPTFIPVTKSALKAGYKDPERQAWLKEERRLQDPPPPPPPSFSRDLKPLEVGDTVPMEPLLAKSRVWKEATVSKNLTYWSVKITNNKGQTYRENKSYLMKSAPATKSVPNTTRCPCSWFFWQ